MELYKINNNINNIKNDIIKTLKKEDGIRFRLYKDALNKYSFPYYDTKYEDLVINNNNDDTSIKQIVKQMNIENLNNNYNIVKSYLELFNTDYDDIFNIIQKRRKLEIKYDEMIKIKEDLEIIIDNYNARNIFIKNMIKIIIIYLIITIIYILWNSK